VLGAVAAGWMLRCIALSRRDQTWLALFPLGGAYAVMLAAGAPPVDPWAAGYGALLFAGIETAQAAAASTAGHRDPAISVRYWRAVAVATLGGFGAGELLLAAAGSGGSGGPEVTALGVAAASAALALLAATARQRATPGTR
jgi:hypothetical protein